MNTQKINVDVAILGAGPGGYVAAIRAAQLGHKTVIIEKSDLGGVCLNWGCIPTKALLKSAEVARTAKKAKTFGINIDSYSIDFPSVINRSRHVAGQLSRGVQFLMKKNNIDVIVGEGRFVTSDEIEVASKDSKTTISAKYFIIATGARPREVPNFPFDRETILTSKEAMSLKIIPDNMAIIGAGAIGVEFADFYQAMGSEVTIIEMLPHILPLEDDDISIELEKQFKRKKIRVKTNTRVDAIEIDNQQATLHLLNNDKSEIIIADKVLVAIGVQANIENIGLEESGVNIENGWIKTNAFGLTNIPHIYAIGDVSGPPLLAHVASHQGIIAVEHLSKLDTHPIKENTVPGCTYSTPQVASVGLTERAAIAAGYEVKIGIFPYKASGRALAVGASEGFTKLVFDAKYNQLLGAHIIGSEATEMIAEAGLGLNLEITAEELIHTVHAHPTLAEMIMEAALVANDQSIHI
jgi:dihydrolipoamide dehydrogenase